MTQILVDGSNVLYWRSDQPDVQLPTLVARALQARRYAPIVHFDHSIGKYLSLQDLSALQDIVEVAVAPRGTSADEVLLDACMEGQTQIVSCDRFRNWRNQHPRLRGNWLVTGRFNKGGQVSFSKKLKPVAI